MRYYLRKTLKVAVIGSLGLAAVFMLAISGMVQAQNDEPRPTPTNMPDETPAVPTPVPSGNEEHEEVVVRGSIQGMVYVDVTGDGRCINTGVEGEGPIEGIPVEFVSSDEQTIITLTSGPDGQFGLFAAGASYWGVSARPGADWVVTTEPTIYVPIYADSLSATDVNFCVQQASVARVVLPASGAQQPLAWGWLALAGLLFVGLGFVYFWRERQLSY